MKLIDAALQYAAAGIPVFPLHWILLNIILQERRPFVCILSFLFVRTHHGRMVD